MWLDGLHCPGAGDEEVEQKVSVKLEIDGKTELSDDWVHGSYRYLYVVNNGHCHS